MLGVTSVAGTTYHSITPHFKCFLRCSVFSFLCSVLWISVCLLVFFPLFIVLSIVYVIIEQYYSTLVTFFVLYKNENNCIVYWDDDRKNKYQITVALHWYVSQVCENQISLDLVLGVSNVLYSALLYFMWICMEILHCHWFRRRWHFSLSPSGAGDNLFVVHPRVSFNWFPL
jgi:hypothetical protein